MCCVSSRSIFCSEVTGSYERRISALEGSEVSLTCKLYINLFNRQGGFSLKEGRDGRRKEGWMKRREKRQADLRV